MPEPLQKLRALVVARHPEDERGVEENTRDNIARHYDLSNDMFATFLDATMTYSSALFVDPPRDGAHHHLPRHRRHRTGTRHPDACRPRAGAQRRKIDRLLDQAGVGDGTRVLEIGTGWGELCIRAAQRGATVRSVTLSSEQKALAEERIAAAGLSDRVTVDLLDYRAVDGEYDAVVSVEMIEAVGYEFWPTYFEKIDALLAPGGKVAIQAITMPHDRMLATRNTYTWVNKYIFPGGFLPSVEGDRRDHPTPHHDADQRPALDGPALRRDPAAVGPGVPGRRRTRCTRSASTASSTGCGTSTSSTPGPGSPRSTSTSSRSPSPGRTADDHHRDPALDAPVTTDRASPNGSRPRCVRSSAATCRSG